MDEFHVFDFIHSLGYGFVLGVEGAIDDRRMARAKS